MQLILNIISILAFFMSLTTWIVTFITHRMHVSVEVKDFAKRNHVVQFYLYIQNNSATPFTVSGISIVSGSRKYPCEYLPKLIRTQNDRVIIETPYLPVNFSSHQGQCFAFEFLNCQDISLAPGKKVDLEIYTNQKTLKKSLLLPQQDKILHLH